MMLFIRAPPTILVLWLAVLVACQSGAFGQALGVCDQDDEAVAEGASSAGLLGYKSCADVAHLCQTELFGAKIRFLCPADCRVGGCEPPSTTTSTSSVKIPVTTTTTTFARTTFNLAAYEAARAEELALGKGDTGPALVAICGLSAICVIISVMAWRAWRRGLPVKPSPEPQEASWEDRLRTIGGVGLAQSDNNTGQGAAASDTDVSMAAGFRPRMATPHQGALVGYNDRQESLKSSLNTVTNETGISAAQDSMTLKMDGGTAPAFRPRMATPHQGTIGGLRGGRESSILSPNPVIVGTLPSGPAAEFRRQVSTDFPMALLPASPKRHGSIASYMTVPGDTEDVEGAVPTTLKQTQISVPPIPSHGGSHTSTSTADPAGTTFITSASLGKRVMVKGFGGGTLAFLGPVHFAPGTGDWCGIQLDVPDGKTDGQVKGVRYFECSHPLGGVIVSLRSRKVSVIGYDDDDDDLWDDVEMVQDTASAQLQPVDARIVGSSSTSPASSLLTPIATTAATQVVTEVLDRESTATPDTLSHADSKRLPTSSSSPNLEPTLPVPDNISEYTPLVGLNMGASAAGEKMGSPPAVMAQGITSISETLQAEKRVPSPSLPSSEKNHTAPPSSQEKDASAPPERYVPKSAPELVKLLNRPPPGKTSAGADLLRCDYCNFETPFKNNLGRHMKKAHNL